MASASNSCESRLALRRWAEAAAAAELHGKLAAAAAPEEAEAAAAIDAAMDELAKASSSCERRLALMAAMGEALLGENPQEGEAKAASNSCERLWEESRLCVALR